ncbi:hypothetical protein HFD88_006491 [Aspergillus terreus]|nr:hypothetical protein HFD88_006491 [Aspergillus terreus]
MDMNHLIGQRFNLISKSDIRYVGTLHEINPEASTIALENVASFGTEGRRGNPAEEIPPSASVYEYIVFRGSDVKDISVAEEKDTAPPEPPQVPDDPAILGSMSRPGPNSQGLPPHPPPQQPQAPRQAPPGYPPQPQFQQGFYPPYGRFGGPPFPPGPGFPNMPYGAPPPPGWFPPPGQGFPQGPGQFPPQMPIGPPGQQPSPGQQRPGPGPVNVPKGTSELPVGDRPTSKPASRDATPAPAAQKAPTPPVESKPPVTEALQAATGPTQGAAKVPPTGPKSGRVQPAIPISAPAKPPVPNIPAGTPQAAITEATRAATAAVAAAMAKLPQPGAQKKPGDASVEGVTKQMADMKPYENRNPRGGQPRGRGGNRGHYQGSKKIEVPDTDYDFETANAKFNKQDLVKEAIATGSPAHEEAPVVPDGDLEAPEPHPESQSVTSYNKAASFFDNISSEARDREEGTGARVHGREWRGEEEKRNIETFGQGSVDGYRGYRGRGRGRGYGRGRGGYSRGYSGRGRGGMRGRGASQSTGVPTPN